MPTDCHCPNAPFTHSYSCGYRNSPTPAEAGPRNAQKFFQESEVPPRSDTAEVAMSDARYPGWKPSEQTLTEWHAEQLFSSLEAWQRSPEDHRVETPKRFVKALKQLTEREPFNFTVFPAKKQDMVTLGPIPFYTLCAHHIVPFHGQAYVSYVPDQMLAGLSKFARTVQQTAKGFWVQEELTDAIADFLEEKLEPLGVGVVLKAEHMCMAMRGVQVAGVITTTATMRGVYSDHDKTAKAEFLRWINDGKA